MKRFAFISLPLLLASHLFAQTWNWEWIQPDTRITAGDRLIQASEGVFRFAGDNNLCYLYAEPTPDFWFTLHLIRDTDPAENHANWVNFPISENGLDPTQVQLYTTSDSLLHAKTQSQVGDIIQLRSYNVTPSITDAPWVENHSAHLDIPRADSFGYIEISCFGDVNDDNFGDWVLAVNRSDSCFIDTWFGSAEGTWNHTSLFLYRNRGEALAIQSLNLAELDGTPGREILLEAGSAWIDGMHYGVRDQHLFYLPEFSQDTQDYSLIEPDEFNDPYMADINGDGIDEMIKRAHVAWCGYQFVDDSRFVFVRTLSAPSGILGFQYNFADQNQYFCYTQNFKRIDWGWYEAYLCQWTWEESLGSWVRIASIDTNCDEVNIVQIRPLFLDSSFRNAFVVQSLHTLPDGDGYRTGSVRVSALESNPTPSWEMLTDYTFNGNGYSPFSYANLDNDPELEVLTLNNLVLTEYDNAPDWVIVHTWTVPDHGWNFTTTDLDNDGRDDVLFSDGAALLNRASGDSIQWIEQYPFASLDPPIQALPCCIADINGDGRNDLLFSECSALLNTSDSAVEDGSEVTFPSRFTLLPPYPNPFNAATTLTLLLPRRGYVKVDVTDLLGRKVAVLEDGVLAAGEKRLVFNVGSLASGTYFIRATHEAGPSQIKRVILIK